MESSLTLYGCPLSVFRGFRFLSTSEERLTWVPHLRLLRLACQSPLDLFRHLSHITCGADKATLLRIYLVLVHPNWIMVPMSIIILSLVPLVF